MIRIRKPKCEKCGTTMWNDGTEWVCLHCEFMKVLDDEAKGLDNEEVLVYDTSI